MVNSESESNVVGELAHRTLKELCIIDPRLFVSTKVKDIEVWSWKKSRSKNGLYFWIAGPVI